MKKVDNNQIHDLPSDAWAIYRPKTRYGYALALRGSKTKLLDFLFLDGVIL